MAIGVGSLTGVRGFSRAFHGMLLREARTLMAADLSVRVFALPDAEQTAVMEKLEQRGVRRTWITETLSMVSSGTVANPVLVSIKAVDPHVYPFYGAVKLDPPASLPQVLDAGYGRRLRRPAAALASRGGRYDSAGRPAISHHWPW